MMKPGRVSCEPDGVAQVGTVGYSSMRRVHAGSRPSSIHHR
jgi:hypothetical protein